MRINREATNAYNRAYRQRTHALVRGSLLKHARVATPKASVSPHVTDLAWAAGFIEGEGYIGRCGIKKKTGTLGSSTIMISQVQKFPLSQMQKFFGGSVRLSRRLSLGQRPVWCWSVNGARARGVMMTLFHWFSPKRKNQVMDGLCGPGSPPMLARGPMSEIARQHMRESWVKRRAAGKGNIAWTSERRAVFKLVCIQREAAKRIASEVRV